MSTLQYLDDLFIKAFMSNPCPMAISEIESYKFIQVNDALLRTLGFEKEEIIGKNVWELDMFVDTINHNKAVQLLNDQGYLRDFETYVRCKNDRIINGVFSADIFSHKGSAYLLSVMNDVTAKRQLEQEITRLEKLNLIGQMSAGISHEVRNPMTTVRGFLQLLQKKPEYGAHAEYFDLMISELDRANSIMSDFLSITKSDQLSDKYERQDLRVLLEKIRPLIEADALEKNIRLLFCLIDTPHIIFNEKEIRQLLLNLARNGFDAMPAGGTLTIKTAYQDNHVTLIVQDQGKGIDKAILNKLGTPFVTTKENGTGLGLAICFGIAHRHNATINVDTSDKGTTFKIRFPITKKPSTPKC